MSVLLLVGGFVAFIILGLLLDWVTSLLICLSTFTFLFFLYQIVKMFDKRKLNKIRRNYNEKENESRRIDGRTQTFERRRVELPEEPDDSTTEFDGSSERTLLPTNASISSGEDRKTSSRANRRKRNLRRLLRRRKR